MTPAKAGYHHGDLRNALVVAAVELVEAGDVESFSLREVARRVGVSANATYRHFDDKASLLVAVTRAGFDHMAASMLSALHDSAVAQTADLVAPRSRRTTKSRRDGSPTNATRTHVSHARADSTRRLRAVGRAYVEFALARPALFRAMFGPFGVRTLAPRMADGGDGTSSSPFQLLVDALRDLVDDGRLGPDDVDEAAFHAWVVVHGCATLVLEGAVPVGDAASRSARIDALLDFAIRGLVGGARVATRPAPSSGGQPGKRTRATSVSTRSARSR